MHCHNPALIWDSRILDSPRGAVLAILFALLCSPITWAEDSIWSDESDYLIDIPVISSATRLPQEIQHSPVAVTRLDRRMIVASGATEVPQLMRLVPGLLTYYHSGNHLGMTNGGPTVEYPGDLEISIDGRSIYQPIFSAVYWPTIGLSIDDIEYIEVIRGSNAAAYGSNAFLGAVNIVTNKLNKKQGTSVRSLAGSANTRDLQIENRGSVLNSNYALSAYYRHNSGFDSQQDGRPISMVKDNNEGMHLQGEILLTPSTMDEVRLSVGLSKSLTDIPAEGLQAANKGFRNRNSLSSFQLVRWQRNFLNNDSIRLQFYHNRTNTDEIVEFGLISEALGVPANFIPLLFDGQLDQELTVGLEDALSERYDLEFEHRLDLGQSSRMVWGMAVRHDRMRSEWLFNNSATQQETSYRLFSNLEYHPIDALRINAGLLAEDSELVGTMFSPRLATNYTLAPGHDIRVSATRSHRKPSILEALQDSGIRFADGTLIDGDVINDPDIDDSRVTEFDIGYMGRYMSDRMQLELRAIHSEAEGVIGDRRTANMRGAAVFRSNLINWTKKSAELQLRYSLNTDTFFSLQYAYTDFIGENVGRPEIQWNPPRHNMSLLAATKIAGINVSSTISHQSNSRWEVASEGEYLPRYTRLDLRLGKKFKIGSGTLNAELIGQNLIESYAEYRVLNQFEPRVFLQLTFESN